ncbi:MAG: endonuclease Q family protein [Candidatus Orphnella occulta]|nr:endonuclease Q family protein [Candidatus Orphnella occulta]
MKFTADFHVHTKYSRATSKAMDLEHIAEWSKLKGIDLVGTGDFTHPAWFKELRGKLKQLPSGLYEHNDAQFILTAEVSNMYSKNGRGRRIHTILVAPNLEVAGKIGKELGKRGNILSDGRPIFGFDVKDIVKLCLDISPDCMIIPAHIFTPWFSLFGSRSGFDTIEECFEEETKNIYALETGLSSDPAMNWRISALDKYTLLSNSDAHSPAKLGREVNVFDTEMSYKGVIGAIKHKTKKNMLFTVEFFPEEGKYHFDGHRDCGIQFSPEETKRHKGLCPKCNRPLTVGVMSRVDDLADRPDGFVPKNATPFKRMVPLQEIIAEAHKKGVQTKSVQSEYQRLVHYFGTEFEVLLHATEADLASCLSERLLQAVVKVRNGDLIISPGYDGEFGRVDIFTKEEKVLAASAPAELF